jgi:2-oxoglutarate ferredoxin oxidoreductase subunit gamma
MTERSGIRLGGYGGQGIIRAGYIIGQAAAIYDHKNATFTQDYGPEARGGSCRADVIISDSGLDYPYLETPTVLIALSQPAYDKYVAQTKKGTLIIIDEDLVRAKENGQRVLAVPARLIAEELGRTAVANTVVLGFLVAVTGVVSARAMREAVLASVPPNTKELNLKAFERGYRYGQSLAPGR